MGLAFLFSHIIPHLFKKVFAWRGVISDKEPTCQCRRHRWRFNPWVGKIPKGGHGNPLQYFCLENPVDRGAWQATVHGIVKSLTWLKQLSMHVCMKNAEMLSNEKTLGSPLDNKEIKLVNPKGNQSWIIHWKDWCWSWSSNALAAWCKESTHWKRVKVKDAGKDWRQEEKGGGSGLDMRSRFGHVRLFATPGTVASQAPLSTGFSRQEYLSGLPFPFLRIFPTQELNPFSCTASGFVTIEPPLGD